jgi:hypothetical protein
VKEEKKNVTARPDKLGGQPKRVKRRSPALRLRKPVKNIGLRGDKYWLLACQSHRRGWRSAAQLIKINAEVDFSKQCSYIRCMYI